MVFKCGDILDSEDPDYARRVAPTSLRTTHGMIKWFNVASSPASPIHRGKKELIFLFGPREIISSFFLHSVPLIMFSPPSELCLCFSPPHHLMISSTPLSILFSLNTLSLPVLSAKMKWGRETNGCDENLKDREKLMILCESSGCLNLDETTLSALLFESLDLDESVFITSMSFDGYDCEDILEGYESKESNRHCSLDVSQISDYPFHSIPHTVVLAVGESVAQKDLLRGKWNVLIDSFLDPDEKKLNFTSREKDGEKMSVSFIRYLDVKESEELNIHHILKQSWEEESGSTSSSINDWMNEKGWLLVGISGIDISSRIKKVVGGWDAMEASILHRHSSMGKYGSCHSHLLGLYIFQDKYLGLSPHLKRLPILSLLPLPTLIEPFQEFCCSQQGSEEEERDWESHQTAM